MNAAKISGRAPVKRIALAELHVARLPEIPRSLRVWGRTTAVLLVLGLLVLLFAPWQQIVRGKGKVVAYSPTDREQHLHAPIKGRVKTWFVAEGRRVTAGDPIVELVDVDPKYLDRLEIRKGSELQRIDAANAQARGLEEQGRAFERSGQLEVTAARLKVKMAEQKLAAAENQLTAAVAEAETSRKNLERVRQLYDKTLVSKRDVELAELSFAQATAARNLAEAAVSEASANKVALEADVMRVQADAGAKVAKANAEVQKAQAELAYAQGDLAKLEVEISRQQSRLVRAPTTGTVVHIDGNEGGGIVKAGQHLATLVPETSSRAVELFVDGNDAPLVTPGRRVRLQFEGWPAVQFVGWPSVAVGTFGGRVAFVDPASTDGAGRIRVLVTPDPGEPAWPNPGALRQQVRAMGWVLLEEVTVGWELWRIINGFPPALREDSSPKHLEGSQAAPLADGGNR